MTPPRPRPDNAHRRDVVSAALLLSAVAWLAVSFSNVAGAWGLDTLRHVPGVLVAVTVAGLALALIPAVAAQVRRAAGTLGDALAAHGPLPCIAVALITFVFLLIPRDALHFIGDSGLRLAAITVRGDTSTVFPQAAWLDRMVNLHLARGLRDFLPITDPDALQLTGALVGAMWAATGLALLRALGLVGAPLGGAVLVLLLSGVPVHFAGYDKFGPLTLGLALATTGAVRAFQGARPWLLMSGVLVALLSHRTGLLVLPAAIVVLVALVSRGGTPRRQALLALGAVLVAAILVVPQAFTSAQSIDRTRHLSGWAPRRLWDALQLLWFLTPLWLGGIAAAVSLRAWPMRADETRWPPQARLAALLALVPSLGLLVVVRGSQGASRDWDMYVPVASLVALATSAALGTLWRRSGVGPRDSARSLALAIALSGGTGMALWTLHMDPAAQLARIGDQLRVRAAWSNEAWARAQDFMGIHELRSGRPESAIAHWNLAIAGAPNPRFFYQVALANIRLGRLAEAREGFDRTQARDPANADVWVGRAMVASRLDSLPAALAYADSALARQPRKWDALEMRRKLLQYQAP